MLQSLQHCLCMRFIEIDRTVAIQGGHFARRMAVASCNRLFFLLRYNEVTHTIYCIIRVERMWEYDDILADCRCCHVGS